jgi:cardiolipin synthase
VEYVGGNRLTLLKNGDQYFPALVAALDAARKEIFLESYIFANDETGSLITDALARAAARGVRAHLLIDGFGARDFPARFRDALERAGARLLVFRPPLMGLRRLRRGRLRRMHRKLAAIDGRVAFVGGINVIDDYETPYDDPRVTPPRFDYAVRIEGPLAAQVRTTAARLWRKVAWSQSRHRDPLEPDRPVPHAAGTQRGALVFRDSLQHRRDIENAYLAHLAAARVEVIIACAYFFPGRRFRRALVEAAGRKVRVRLLLQGKIEYAFLHFASRGLYGELIEAGIEIHEYNASLLHAKVAVFDRRISCVGSSNIDPLSLLLAREANVFIEDPGFAAELRLSLEAAMREGASALGPRQWERQPLWRKMLVWVTYWIARNLISFLGAQRYH